MDRIKQGIRQIAAELSPQGVNTQYSNQMLQFTARASSFYFYLVTEENAGSVSVDIALLPVDLLVTCPSKIVGIVLSKLKLNTVVFARKCEVKKLGKPEAELFLQKYHLMNATSSSSNFGLYHRGELVAIASFSKGRKMRRLPVDKRSYELIRFCSKSGFSVAGGLSKLLKHFVAIKSAGDVMTYVDKQLSDGSSFVKAGFKKMGEQAPVSFLVNRFSFERCPYQEGEAFDPEQFYKGRTGGNVKLVYQPG